jgi:hypothetical protein
VDKIIRNRIFFFFLYCRRITHNKFSNLRMFISDQGSVWACGWSADGQTGLGHYNNTDRISKCVGDIVGEKVIKVTSSADCVLALNGINFF